MLEEDTNQRQEWIDFFKGVAICGVVLVHAGGGALRGICGWLGASGAYGVQMFLIIAIYLSCYSLEKREKNNTEVWKISLKWFLERVWRLTPLYYLALVIYILVVPDKMNIWLGSMAEGVNAGNMIAHLFYVHSLFPYYANSVMWVEWYLGVLVLYYLILPVVFRQIRSLKRAVVFAIMVLMLSFGITEILMNLQPLRDQYIWDGWVDTYSFVRQLPTFAVGILIYWIEKSVKESIKRIRLNEIGYGLLLAGIIGFVLIGLTERKYSNYYFHITLIGLLSISFGLILSGAICQKRKIFESSFFREIGKNCYGIYLFHYLVIVVVDIVITRLGVLPEIVAVGMKFGIAMISCMIFNACYEKVLGKKLFLWGRREIDELL